MRTLLDPREILIDRVIEQIKTDISNGDVTAIFELLANISDRELEAYLPEGA